MESLSLWCCSSLVRLRTISESPIYGSFWCSYSLMKIAMLISLIVLELFSNRVFGLCIKNKTVVCIPSWALGRLELSSVLNLLVLSQSIYVIVKRLCFEISPICFWSYPASSHTLTSKAWRSCWRIWIKELRLVSRFYLPYWRELRSLSTIEIIRKSCRFQVVFLLVPSLVSFRHYMNLFN